MNRPNILFIMCDQLRVDAIAALGNSVVMLGCITVCMTFYSRLVKLPRL
jgi:Arylsulfatase A and related enzymes